MAAISLIQMRVAWLAEGLAPLHPKLEQWLTDILLASLRLRTYLIALRAVASDAQVHQWNR